MCKKTVFRVRVVRQDTEYKMYTKEDPQKIIIITIVNLPKHIVN